MALVSKKGSFTLGGVGTQAITGVGFQPDVVIFFDSRTNASGSYPAGGQIGIGCATSPTEQWRLAATMDHGSTRNYASTWWDDTGCIGGGRSLNGVLFLQEYVAALDSMDSDGFTIDVTDASSTDTTTVHYLAIGGLTAAKAGVFVMPNAGTLDMTDVGFQPDALLFAWGMGGPYYDARLSLGVMTGPTEGGAFSFGSEDDTAAVQSTVWNDGDDFFLGQAPNTTGADFRASLDSFDADGFNLTISDTPPGGRDCFYLALQGGSWLAGIDDEGTSAAAKDTTTTGFDPVGVLLFGNNNATLMSATAPSTSTDAVFTIGAGDGTDEGCVWTGEDDANGSSVARRRQDTGRAFWHATPATSTGGSPTTVNEADLSLGTEKFTLTWTQAGSSRKFAFLAFGDAAASTVDGAAVIASTSTVTVAATPIRESAATIASSSSFTVAGTVDTPTNYVDGAAVIASTSSVTAAAQVDYETAATIASSSTVTAAAQVDYESAATIASSSSFTVAATVDTDNLVENYGFEVDTSGWDGSTGNWDFNGGSTITRVNDQAHEGSWSGLLETPGSLQAEGVGYSIGSPAASQDLRFSAWIYSTAGGEDIDVKLGERSANDAFAQYTLSAGWNLCEVSWTTTGGAAWICVRTQFGAAQAVAIYIDDVRVGLPIVEGSAAISSSSSITAAAEVDYEAALTIASSSSVQATATPIRDALATIAASSTVTASAEVDRESAAVISSSSTVTVAGEVTRDASASITSASTITVSSEVDRDAAATVASSSTVAVAAEVDYEAALAISSSSSVAATAEVDRESAASISSSSTITASAEVTRDAAAQITSAATVTVAAQADYEAETAIASTSTFTVAGTVDSENFVSGAATISSSSSASVAAQVDYGAAAVVASSSTVATTASLTVGGAAQVAAVSQLQAAAQLVLQAAAQLDATSQLAAEATPIRGAQLAIAAASTIEVQSRQSVEGSASIVSSSSVSAAAVVARGGAVQITSTSTVAADGSLTLGAQVEVSGVSVFQAVAQLDAAGQLQVASTSGLAATATPIRGGALAIASVCFIAARAYGALQGLGCEVRVRTHTSASVATRARYAAALGVSPAFAVALQPRTVTAGDLRVRRVVEADLTIGV